MVDHVNNIGLIHLDKDSFEREFYFYQGKQDEDATFHTEDKIELAKECQLLHGKAYIKEILEPENQFKFDNKRIEINPLKTAGVGDYRDLKYIEKLNSMTILPDRNKRKATYIQ